MRVIILRGVIGLSAAVTALFMAASFVAVPAQAKLPEVMRIAGQDRYETASKIRHQILGDTKTVYVVSGQSPVDALSVAPVAAKNGAGVLLSESQSLSSVTADSFRRNQPEHSLIIGGTRVLFREYAMCITRYHTSSRNCANI